MQCEDFQGYDSATQLFRAAIGNDVVRVRQLLRLGCPIAVVDAQTVSGGTALRRASSLGYEAVVVELLARGADVNMKDTYGWSPLMGASFRSRRAVVRLLCDVPGIDLAARGGDKNLSAPGYALLYQNADDVVFLRSRDASE